MADGWRASAKRAKMVRSLYPLLGPTMSTFPPQLWWQAALAANGASSERAALHQEFAAQRQALAAQLKFWLDEAIQSGDVPLVGSCAEAHERVCGVHDDLAHWVWVFEMDERERSLFRNMRSEAILCAAAGSIDFDPTMNGPEPFGLLACEPGHVGARRFARAGHLVESLEWANSAEAAPFMVEGVACEPEPAGLRRWEERPAAWDRQPWVDALARAYPDLAAEGLFSNMAPVEADDAGGGRGARWRKKNSFPRARQPSSAAQTLYGALDQSLAVRCECWPTSSLRTWLESLELEAASQTPALAPVSGRRAP